MPKRHPEIVTAAKAWKERCLLEGRSIFTEERLWTERGFEEIHRFFIDRPDEGSGDFFQKLEEQLRPAAPETRKLVAEMLWVLYLPVISTSMRASTKSDQVRRVWRWSGDELPEEHKQLGEVLDRGVLHPGTAYNAQRWREFAFFCRAMEAWFALDRSRRGDLLGDPWGFGEWLDARESSSNRQFRHILLFLLFPEHYEPIASMGHKEKLIRVLDPTAGGEVAASRLAIDRRIHEIRRRLESEHGQGFSFYESPVRELWLEEAEARETLGSVPETDEELVRWFRERFGEATIWVFSPGRRGVYWPEFVDRGILAVGSDEIGDISRVESREEIHEMLIDQYGVTNPVNDSLALWELSREIRDGDVVLAKSGLKDLHGYGVVTGSYRFDPEREHYRHVLPVEWRATTPIEVEGGHGLPIKTLTRGVDFGAYLARLVRRLEDAEEEASNETSAAVDSTYDIERAMDGVFLPVEIFQSILDSFLRRKNVILQGPPGVGKTFLARRLAWALIGQKKPLNLQMVQFHQSYSYEDFVQGWRPNETGGFVLRDGVFLEFCERARREPGENFVFVIDEINRGNLSRIFGELLMLVEGDKRGDDYALPLTYSPNQRFGVPENLYLLGMMNTADRSLAMVDYALRRRFAFVSIPPAFGSEAFRAFLLEAGAPPKLVDWLDRTMSRLNETITADTKNLGPGFEIGHSYFVPTDDDEGLDEAWFRGVLDTQVAPLLREYFFDQADRAEALLADFRL